jgi:hypothetical protein
VNALYGRLAAGRKATPGLKALLKEEFYIKARGKQGFLCAVC